MLSSFMENQRWKNMPMRVISVKMPEELLEKIHDYLDRHLSMTRSEFIREAITYYLKHKHELLNEEPKKREEYKSEIIIIDYRMRTV